VISAATAFVGALPADRRACAVSAFGDRERLNWHYGPRRREGVAFKEMAARARGAAHDLMRASLSSLGYGKATNLIQLAAPALRARSSPPGARDLDCHLRLC